jgi:KUP system potassium uptake protein
VVEEMVANKELDISSAYPSLHKHNLPADFKFIILEKFLSYDNEFTLRDGFILHSYFGIKKFALADDKAFGLDTSETHIEKIPLVVTPTSKVYLKRTSYRLVI